MWGRRKLAGINMTRNALSRHDRLDVSVADRVQFLLR